MQRSFSALVAPITVGNLTVGFMRAKARGSHRPTMTISPIITQAKAVPLPSGSRGRIARRAMKRKEESR